MKTMPALVLSLMMLASCAFAEPVKVILDTDMLTDFDDVGALACLHALADAGECEILATVSCTRGNASVGAIEVINAYYGRPDIPVGCVKEIGVCGGGVTPSRDRDHDKYRKLIADYAGWVRHANADEAPDANDVYRRVLAAQPDHSVVICSIGFLTNLRRLLETKGDACSPLDGRALVAKKVKKWVAMAFCYPKGVEYNSRWDVESSRIVLEKWPTPMVVSDYQYGFDTYAGRVVAEQPGSQNPVKDVFKGNIPPREDVLADPAKWRDRAFGLGGRSAWDETAVLAAVRGETAYFNVQHGVYRMTGNDGADMWVPDFEGRNPHVRLTEKLSKDDVGKIIDELICRDPQRRKVCQGKDE